MMPLIKKNTSLKGSGKPRRVGVNIPCGLPILIEKPSEKLMEKPPTRQTDSSTFQSRP